MFNGIEINDAIVLRLAIRFSLRVLLSLGLAIFAYYMLKYRKDKKLGNELQQLKSEAETNPAAAKKLKRLKRKNEKAGKKGKWIVSFVCAYLLLGMVISLSKAIPAWMDYVKKDYVVYEGEYVVSDGFLGDRSGSIWLKDRRISLRGTLGIEEGEHNGTLVYSRRMEYTLGKG